MLALTLAADWAEAADPDWGRLYMLVTPECSEGVLCRRCREEEDAGKEFVFNRLFLWIFKHNYMKMGSSSCRAGSMSSRSRIRPSG